MRIRLSGTSALVVEPNVDLPLSARSGRVDRMDRLSGLAVCAAEGALVQAGVDFHSGKTIGIAIGSAYGCHVVDEAYYRGILEAGAEVPFGGASPRLFVYTLPSSSAGEISIRNGLKGPMLVEISGVTAGLVALEEAYHLLLETLTVDAMVVCAVDTTSVMLTQMVEEAPLADAALALVLTRDAELPGGVSLMGAASSFVSENPTLALCQARERLPRHGNARVLQGRSDLGAAGPLWPLLALTDPTEGDRHAPYLLVSSDRQGHAACCLVTLP